MLPAFVVFKTVTDLVIQNPKSKTCPEPSRRIQNLLLGFLLLLYLVVALAHAALAPLTTGPDELAHYEYMNFIAQHGRLPLTREERSQASYKSDQPPLYHLITALPASLVNPAGPPYLKRFQDHLRRDLIGRQRHAWGLYNTQDEGWPYRAEVLRWQVGRWVAILFGVATVWVTFRLARDEVFSGNAWLALAAAATVAFIPRFDLSGAMLNYETTLAFFAALFLWALLRIANSYLQNEDNLPPTPYPLRTTHHASRITFHVSRFTFHVSRFTLYLGLFAGLAIVTKLSALILPLEIGLGLALIARHYGWGWRVWARHTLIAGLVTLGVAGCWFGFVLYQFNTVASEGWWLGLLRPLIAADSSDATTNRLLNFISGGQAGFTGAAERLEPGPFWLWLKAFFQNFWVVDIENELPLGESGLVIALGLTGIAATGLLMAWLIGKNQRLKPGEGQGATLTAPQRLILSLLLWHVGLAMVLPLIRYLATFSLADTAQGRHLLFQTAPAIGILGVWGLLLAVRQWRRNLQFSAGVGDYLAVPLLPLFLSVWSASQLQTMTWAYLPPLPIWTTPEVKDQISHPLNEPLNEAVTLLGYDRQFDPLNRMLRLDLWWQATALSPVDYLTQVTLLDGQGQVQARWLGYSAGGRYPTRAWDVGDIVRDTAWLPTGGLVAGQYRLELELLPVTLNPGGAVPEASRLALEPVTLEESTLRIFDRTLPFASDVARAASGYSVWHEGQPFTTPRLFEYRETILVTLQPPLPDQERVVRLVGPSLSSMEYPPAFAPVQEAETFALFIVGADWPSGDYQLQVTLNAPGQAEQQVKTAPLLQIVNRWDRNFEEPAIPHRLDANFANQVKLLGYELGANRAAPGGGIPLTLYWQGLDWMGENYTIFTKLLAADQTVHGGRERLPQEGYSTLYWAPGEIITDAFGVPVEADAPEGVYTLNLGLYKLAAGQAQSLPLVQDGQFLETTSLNLGPIKVGQAPPGFTLSQAEPQRPLAQPLGEAPHLTLIGYDLLDEHNRPVQDSTSPIEMLKLSLYWRSEAILPTDYTTFVHLRNEAGEIIAQQDQPPLQGAYPTSLWDPGEIIRDEIDIPLPPELAGRYELVVGLYEVQNGARLVVPGRPENSLTLTTLEFKP